ncbi:ATP-binding protein [Streptomyces sp. NPDC059568]|uniref:ATP-binding protein n=1 Tax=Streptomyces sp. NPDC059568 TaxID=3346868 RepID=UPI0036B6439D
MTTTSVRPPQAAPCPAAAVPRTRQFDAMRTSFDISPRRGSEDVPERDAQRVCAMRRLARARMTYCGLDAVADDVALVVSELVTNAVKHSRGTHITMDLRLHGAVLRIAVRDDTSRLPQIRPPGPDAESGRGLILVKGIADQYNGSWGVSADGTTTWCTLTVGSC